MRLVGNLGWIISIRGRIEEQRSGEEFVADVFVFLSRLKILMNLNDRSVFHG